MGELERVNPDTDSTLPTIAFVGAGRMGTALARAAMTAGVKARLAGRDDAIEAARTSAAVMLCVPDAAIEEACAVIATVESPPAFVGHVSGATPLTALAAAAEHGAETFSMHPLQTVPDGHASVAGAACAVSASSADALALARTLASRLGMRPFEVAEDRRAAYHAAACMASNFLVALEEAAAGVLAAAGIEDGRELLAPLVMRTAANWAERGDEALTGPIARGDEATVARHLEALEELDPDVTELYLALARQARAVASERTPA